MALKLSSAFEPFTIALIREIEAAGWTGKITKKGHALMLAPDGVTTCMVSPKVGAQFRSANLGMEFRRWQREQAAKQTDEVAETTRSVEWLPWPVMPPKPLPAAPEPEPDPEHLCEDCLRGFRTLQALSVHRVRAHVRVNCPICARPFSPGNLPRHQATHRAEFPTHEAALAEVHRLRAELARLRDEVATWQGLAEETEESLVNLLGGDQPSR